MAELYPGSAHVSQLGLLASPDREVWEFAKRLRHRQHRFGFLRTRHNHRTASKSGVATALVASDQGCRAGPAAGCRPDHGIRLRSRKPASMASQWSLPPVEICGKSTNSTSTGPSLPAVNFAGYVNADIDSPLTSRADRFSGPDLVASWCHSRTHMSPRSSRIGGPQSFHAKGPG